MLFESLAIDKMFNNELNFTIKMYYASISKKYKPSDFQTSTGLQCNFISVF